GRPSKYGCGRTSSRNWSARMAGRSTVRRATSRPHRTRIFDRASVAGLCRRLTRCGGPGVATRTTLRFCASSLHSVFDGLHRPRSHSLARGLGGEPLLFLGERIDAVARGARGLFHDHELREARQYEEAVLLELLVTDLHEGLD